MATDDANVREQSASRGRPRGQGTGQEEAPEGLVSLLRERLKTELNSRKDVVTETLDEVAETVRRVGEPLREHSSALGEYVDGAAGRLQQFADGLRKRDVGDFGDDLAVLARRYPAAFVATGVAAGILAARFLRSSAEGLPQGAGRRARARGTTGTGKTAGTTRAGR